MAENQTPNQDVLTDIESHAPASLHPIIEAAFKYSKQLIIAVCIIIGFAAIYAVYTGYNNSVISSAQAELGAILVDNPGPERTAKLETLLTSVPGSMKPAVVLELAQANMTDGAYDKAVTYWEMLANESSDMNFIARMGKGKSLLLDGKAADAMAEFKALADGASEAYTIPINRQLALAAEAAGDNAQALAAYKVLAEKNTNDKPFVDYKISQLESK
ncbi:transcriptional regulator [Pseudodesulfovibrio sediminis]|uniref:Tetratricopeptide repeat-like domain-containing protein n=1 Tax=Pseudodesulfovibrio sediminis TaxID=2810563 RepID=A0ABM7P9Q2_9BACT|nr:transcriptional regulator [Pseudodesulfovibrio sediminis]BCS90137.1 hypothetical protein PSDVSF_33790 [Pseudodesulfovibrio sediminis]